MREGRRERGEAGRRRERIKGPGGASRED